MKKFYVTAMRGDDEFTVLKTDDKRESILTARSESEAGNKVEIRMYVEDIEDDDCECFDYDTLSFEKAYYIVDCISGCLDGAEPIADLQEAISIRNEWNEERAAAGGSSDFWVIVDEMGDEVTGW